MSFEPTTQSLSICLEPIPSLNSFQISTGDLLRDEIKKDSEIGKKIIKLSKLKKQIIYQQNMSVTYKKLR